MADQLLGKSRGVEDPTDPGGYGSDGFEFPQVEALVELAPLELFPQLPCAETEPGRAEG